ncbi:P-loop NTPase fold protein [Providencia rettgeri]|uniref:P-loop NTPase fold protein n=1 Tax=Providencia rettgeri TaxID=587 RepID=UPI0018E406BB|nr:P-loop NTPase fold protein [Providencia rettgeri]MBI6201717.1 hypothetical protein [Providencia rettgeri]
MDKNKHIEPYLEYYLARETPPQYAVLLNGNWGSGKTWFVKNKIINNYSENYTFLYVSLYGLSDLSDIEAEFFKQLHPFLSSKTIGFAQKTIKSLIKTTLKIELGEDNKLEINSDLPEIKLPKNLKNKNNLILIFDDLERTSLCIKIVLGYINYLVETQGFKAILIANEEEIPDETNYHLIKEKLIGKTFEIDSNIENVLDDIISTIKDVRAKSILLENKKNILSTYEKSGYNNLRYLIQSTQDFILLYNQLPQEATERKDLLTHILIIYLILAFEFKNNKDLIKEIKDKSNEYIFYNLNSQDNLLNKVYMKYNNNLMFNTIFDGDTWIEIIRNGKINKEKLNNSILNSSYFMNKTRPSWVNLWHLGLIDKNDFEINIEKLKKEITEFKYRNNGIILHISGIYLTLSKNKIINESKRDITIKSIKYIDYIFKNNLSDVKIKKERFNNCFSDNYAGLMYHSENEEFEFIKKYLKRKTERYQLSLLPIESNKILDLMVKDTKLFFNTLSINGSEEIKYYDTPILKHVSPYRFCRSFLSLSNENKNLVCYMISDRYKHNIFLANLKQEKKWLEKVVLYLSYIRNTKFGSIEYYHLHICLNNYFEPALNDINIP